MKNQKGYTGVDIAISVVVITIFIALIGTLVFNFNSNSNEIERIKTLDIDDVERVENAEIKEDLKGTGYYEKIEVVDASSEDIISESDLGERKRISGLVKKVTVTVSYQFRNQTKSVELSTIVAKDL